MATKGTHPKVLLLIQSYISFSFSLSLHISKVHMKREDKNLVSIYLNYMSCDWKPSLSLKTCLLASALFEFICWPIPLREILVTWLHTYNFFYFRDTTHYLIHPLHCKFNHSKNVFNILVLGMTTRKESNLNDCTTTSLQRNFYRRRQTIVYKYY